MNCLFCEIANNRIDSYTIYEDDIVKIFLDIAPTTNGDCLVVPKKHYTDILDIDDKTLLHIFECAKKMFPILKEKLHAEGFTLVQNNGHGQEIKHFHLHITPRYKNDNLEHNYNKKILKDIKDIYTNITK